MGVRFDLTLSQANSLSPGKRQYETSGNDGNYGQGARRKGVRYRRTVGSVLYSTTSIESSRKQVLHRQRHYDRTGWPFELPDGLSNSNNREYLHAKVFSLPSLGNVITDKLARFRTDEVHVAWRA